MKVPQVTVRLSFGHCDVRYGMGHQENSDLAAQVADGELDLILFSFVLVENAMALRAAQWEFVVQLLGGASAAGDAEAGVASGASGAGTKQKQRVALVMDSTHRFFPDICDAVHTGCSGWRAFFPTEAVVSVPRNKMILLNTEAQTQARIPVTSSVDPAVAAQLQRFREHNDSQEKWRVREQAKGNGATTES
jgi:hypothetical protein